MLQKFDCLQKKSENYVFILICPIFNFNTLRFLNVFKIICIKIIYSINRNIFKLQNGLKITLQHKIKF